jgi:hypothetical protein
MPLTIGRYDRIKFKGRENGALDRRGKSCGGGEGGSVPWVEIQAPLHETNVQRDVVKDCWVLMKWAEDQEVEN